MHCASVTSRTPKKKGGMRGGETEEGDVDSCSAYSRLSLFEDGRPQLFKRGECWGKRRERGVRPPTISFEEERKKTISQQRTTSVPRTEGFYTKLFGCEERGLRPRSYKQGRGYSGEGSDHPVNSEVSRAQKNLPLILGGLGVVKNSAPENYLGGPYPGTEERAIL